MNAPLSRRQFVHVSGRASLLAAAGMLQIHVPRAGAASPLLPRNEKIQRAREAALGVLKPSAAQLERGLALHAESLVFDAYGFAPSSAIDGEAFKQAVAARLSDDELVDLREEMLTTRCATDARERAEYFEALGAAGVTCILQNAGQSGNDPQRMIKRVANFTFVTDRLRDRIFKAFSPDDIVAAKASGRHCLYFSTNGVPLRQNWDSTRDELRLVSRFFKLGVRMMHVTYNRRNPLGDGAGEPNDGGLSDFGKAAVAEMNRVGVIVDVAHSGYRTSLEAARASNKPMVASHAACAGLYEHFRGKPDHVIKAICDTGGLMGICLYPRYLGRAGDIAEFLNHIDYMIKKFGADHVAIGTDVGYSSRQDAAERAKVPPRPDGRSWVSVNGPTNWEGLWPADDFRTSPLAQLTLAWTNWPLFTVGMVQRGHSEETIRKVIGGNMLRVARANFPLPAI
jgi:membrane dipeptidase